MGRLGLLLVALAGLALHGLGQDLDGIRQLHAGLSTCVGDDCRHQRFARLCPVCPPGRAGQNGRLMAVLLTS